MDKSVKMFKKKSLSGPKGFENPTFAINCAKSQHLATLPALGQTQLKVVAHRHKQHVVVVSGLKHGHPTGWTVYYRTSVLHLFK